MRRRTALSLAGTALAGVAGCASLSTERNQSPAGTGSLAVAFDALQPAVVELFVDAYEFEAAADSQYLFLSGADATGPDRRFRFDGSEYDPGVDTSYDLVRAPSTFGAPTEVDDWVVFELPETGDGSDAALVGPDGEWRPNDTLRERLAAPVPSLDVTEFEGPSAVPAGDSPTFTVTVSNESDTDGRFLGVLRPPEGSYTTGQLASRSVEAGASVTLEATVDAVGTPTPGYGQGNALRYELDWTGGSEIATLAVE
ncbi:hypothetical protein [Haloarcula onubensis]|uniref:DUF11 domain-containing protein n=1 Tax=Haloarcula onubensis TaxID=2950539 RepID=A0ABU2FJA9_9EURY|nr:hypothetical protein [Halomicroarcula sp. S3CR25-11]MDS0280839.1 hypothetical protein [Halomicroarcula sp. S3CR25-11]